MSAYGEMGSGVLGLIPWFCSDYVHLCEAHVSVYLSVREEGWILTDVLRVYTNRGASDRDNFLTPYIIFTVINIQQNIPTNINIQHRKTF